jgi:hypothetical protein
MNIRYFYTYLHEYDKISIVYILNLSIFVKISLVEEVKIFPIQLPLKKQEENMISIDRVFFSLCIQIINCKKYFLIKKTHQIFVFLQNKIDCHLQAISTFFFSHHLHHSRRIIRLTISLNPKYI